MKEEKLDMYVAPQDYILDAVKDPINLNVEQDIIGEIENFDSIEPTVFDKFTIKASPVEQAVFTGESKEESQNSKNELFDGEYLKWDELEVGKTYRSLDHRYGWMLGDAEDLELSEEQLTKMKDNGWIKGGEVWVPNYEPFVLKTKGEYGGDAIYFPSIDVTFDGLVGDDDDEIEYEEVVDLKSESKKNEDLPESQEYEFELRQDGVDKYTAISGESEYSIYVADTETLKDAVRDFIDCEFIYDLDDSENIQSSELSSFDFDSEEGTGKFKATIFWGLNESLRKNEHVSIDNLAKGGEYTFGQEVSYGPAEDLVESDQVALANFVDQDGDVVFPVGTKFKVIELKGPAGWPVFEINGAQLDMCIEDDDIFIPVKECSEALTFSDPIVKNDSKFYIVQIKDYAGKWKTICHSLDQEYAEEVYDRWDSYISKGKSDVAVDVSFADPGEPCYAVTEALDTAKPEIKAALDLIFADVKEWAYPFCDEDLLRSYDEYGLLKDVSSDELKEGAVKLGYQVVAGPDTFDYFAPAGIDLDKAFALAVEAGDLVDAKDSADESKKNEDFVSPAEENRLKLYYTDMTKDNTSTEAADKTVEFAKYAFPQLSEDTVRKIAAETYLDISIDRYFEQNPDTEEIPQDKYDEFIADAEKMASCKLSDRYYECRKSKNENVEHDLVCPDCGCLEIYNDSKDPHYYHCSCCGNTFHEDSAIEYCEYYGNESKKNERGGSDYGSFYNMLADELQMEGYEGLKKIAWYCDLGMEFSGIANAIHEFRDEDYKAINKRAFKIFNAIDSMVVSYWDSIQGAALYFDSLGKQDNRFDNMITDMFEDYQLSTPAIGSPNSIIDLVDNIVAELPKSIDLSNKGLNALYRTIDSITAPQGAMGTKKAIKVQLKAELDKEIAKANRIVALLKQEWPEGIQPQKDMFRGPEDANKLEYEIHAILGKEMYSNTLSDDFGSFFIEDANDSTNGICVNFYFGQPEGKVRVIAYANSEQYGNDYTREAVYKLPTDVNELAQNAIYLHDEAMKDLEKDKENEQ